MCGNGAADQQQANLLARTILQAHQRSSPKTKLISLYLFDAIARHVQELQRKLSQEDAESAQAMQAANFLRAIQEPAVEVGSDSLASVPPEQRVRRVGEAMLTTQEKARKVMDIWARAGTFDAAILRRIDKAAAQPAAASRSPLPDSGRATSAGPSLAPRDPRQPNVSQPATSQPAVPNVGLPANVLALLGGQAGAAPTQSAAPAHPAPPESLQAVQGLLAQAGGGLSPPAAAAGVASADAASDDFMRDLAQGMESLLRTMPTEAGAAGATPTAEAGAGAGSNSDSADDKAFARQLQALLSGDLKPEDMAEMMGGAAGGGPAVARSIRSLPGRIPTTGTRSRWATR